MGAADELRSALRETRERHPELAEDLDRALALAASVADASEEQLVFEHRWLEAILQSVPIPLVLVEPRTARVTFANRAAERAAGGELPPGALADNRHAVFFCTDKNGQRIADDDMPGARAARGEQLHGYEVDWHTPGGVVSLLVHSAIVSTADGHPGTVVLSFIDVTALKRTELHQQLLAEVSRTLADRLDPLAALDDVADLITRRFSLLASIDLIDDTGNARNAALGHLDHSQLERLARAREAIPASTSTAPIFAAMAGGRVVVLSTDAAIESIPGAKPTRDVVLSFGTDAVLVAPLEARGKLLGSILLARRRGEPYYDADEQDVARAIASRVAIALDNHRLFTELERANDRLALVQEVTEAALHTQTVEEMARVAASGIRRALGADTAAVLLANTSGFFELAASDGLGEEQEKAVRVPVTTGVAGQVLASRTPRIISNIETVEVARPFLRTAGIGSLMVAPLRIGDRVLGVLHVGVKGERPFGRDELLLLQLVSDRAAVGIERMRLFEAERTARADAEAANRMKDEFLATLSHELRTPLNAIVGWTALLQSRSDDPLLRGRGLATIERNAKAQAMLIEDLLDVSRIISGKLRLALDDVDVRVQILAALDAVRPAAESKGVRLSVAIDGGGHLRADGDRLQQIVWNLLSNAVKFTPPGGEVAISAKRSGADLVIEVRDTGVGIPPDSLPFVFERFRQVDSSSTRRHGGLGLGLAIVRHLVELHGGRVKADSPGPGRGATFTVVLPVRAIPRPIEERSAPRSRDASSSSAEPEALRGLRVLAVDDDDDARELVSMVLSQYGADVTAVPSAQAARDAVDRVHPDVIVCDIGMPDEDGIAFIRRLRAAESQTRGPRTPAVALTAFARDEDARRAFAAGFQFYVPKPVEPAQIVACVANLGGRSLEASPS